MKASTLLATSFALMALAPSQSLAVPQKHAKCEIQINTPDNAGLHFFSEDCSTVYVLPPAKGRFVVNGYTPSISNDVCEAIGKIEARQTIIKEQELDVEKTIHMRAQRIFELEEFLLSGELPYGKTAAELTAEIDSLIERNEKQKAGLDSNLRNYVEEKGVYAVMEGSRGSFSLMADYNKLLQEYIDLNKDKGVRFVRMPLKTSYLSILSQSFNKASNELEMKAIKRLRIASGDLKGKTIKTSNGPEAVANPKFADIPTDLQESSFGDGLSGGFETSALGHCLFAAQDLNQQDIHADIAASSIYTYDVQVHRRYAINYNFHELVHIFRESSRRGGFFSRKTVEKLIDTRRTTSWITFHSRSNDAEYEYSDEDIIEIKKEILDRALRQIVDVRTGGKASALALVDASGPNGADVIGTELNKCPHLYCQIGAAGFRVLSAIFGSQKATSELIQNLHADVYEERNEARMTLLQGTSAF